MIQQQRLLWRNSYHISTYYLVHRTYKIIIKTNLIVLSFKYIRHNKKLYLQGFYPWLLTYMPSSLLFSLSLSSHSNSYRLRAIKMILTTMHNVMKTSVKASKTMNESTSEIRIQIQAQSHVHKILHTLVVVSFAFLLNLSISSSSES